MGKQLYLIIEEGEIYLDKMLNPNNWKELQNVTIPLTHKTNNMDKEQQKKLLTEIMEADEKNGLYKQQTAVEWLVDKLETEAITDYSFAQAHKVITLDVYSFNSLVEQAKQMEKEQIVEAFYEGMKTNPFDPNRGRGTMYYNETYGGQGTDDTKTSPNTQNK